MQNPKQSFLETIQELQEVIWWNRSLTKWTRVFSNPETLLDSILSFKGPYLEKVDIPSLYGAPQHKPWRSFANELHIDHDLQVVLQDVLFKGNDLPLYHHQGEATRNILSPDRGHEQADILITVPTAAGKTESFLIPVLQHVLEERKRIGRLRQHQHRLKVLMIYPIKSLEIDQMNRIVEYLSPLNRLLADQKLDPIRVGVWDGDTPRKIVSKHDADMFNKVCVDDHVRGLKCPHHPEEPLLYASTNVVKCEKNHEFEWIAVTRDSIANQGVDILLSTPEALEHLLLHKDNKIVLDSNELKYIVIDEAHIWKGYSGTAFSLLLKRLRHMYQASKPRVIMATATLANPVEFASRLTGNSDVRIVKFKKAFDRGRYQPSVRKADFSRIKPTDAGRLFSLLLALKWKIYNNETQERLITSDAITFQEKVDMEHTLEMLQLLNLIEEDTLNLTKAGENLASFFADTCNLGDFDALSNRIPIMAKTQAFIEAWTTQICLYLPELTELLEQFQERSFVEEAILVEWLVRRGGQFEGEKLLLSLLSIGRVSEMIFDKYHFFLKPSSGLFYCQDCKSVHTKSECTDRTHINVYEMFACTICHEPVLSVDNQYVRLLDQTSSTCSCGTKLEERNVDHAFLHYNSFITYLLSKVTHKLDSRKLLVFGDGRQLIEHVADLTQELDYSLVTDRMGVFLALQQSEIPLFDWLRGLKDGVHDFFRKKTPLQILFRQNRSLSTTHQADLDNLKKAYQDRFAKIAGDFRMRMFEPALLSFTTASEQNTEAEKALMHHLLATILIKSDFRRSGADKYNEYAVESLYNSLRKEFPHYKQLLDEKFSEWIGQLVQKLGIRIEEHKTGKRERKKQVLIWKTDNAEFAKQLRLMVPRNVTYCLTCYKGYPAELDSCAACGSRTVVVGDRLTQGGFLPTPYDNPYRLDHWATEIILPALNWTQTYPDAQTVVDLPDLERTIVLSHRSGVPQVLRSAIEDGFKQKQPSVNVVCATPTMELGIDIGNLDSIVQIGIPPTKSNYIQRTGRAGRRRTSPSVIFNIIRNENAIDGYFYENLSERFLNKPLHRLVIPEASDDMLRMHIHAEVLRYLNFNTTVYKELYDLVSHNDIKPLSRKNVAAILEAMGNKVLKLSKWIFHYFDEIILHLQEVFGRDRSYLEQQVDTLYHGVNSLLPTAVFERFSTLEEQYDTTREESIKESFIQNNRNLPLFLQHLGLFVSFRGEGESVPIFDINERTLEQKSLHYALREGFPGDFDDKKKEPRKGALWRVEARPFEIESVYVEEVPLLKEPVRVCSNTDTCSNPFEVYSSEREICPICGWGLQSLQVYPYRFAFGRPMRTFGVNKRIKTNPILRTIVGEFE